MNSSAEQQWDEDCVVESVLDGQMRVVHPNRIGVEPGAPGHFLRGVSVWHLMTVFTQQILAAGLTMTAKVYEAS